MRNLHVAVVIIVLSIVVNAKCVGESEDNFEHKRLDANLKDCLENFDVHTDMIIRTQDSRKMGAKYLNEEEVVSRDECQKICCETENCDVYIYEQKIPGSCYLFHCGSPDDFKCKFTQHRNYTSAILTLNNHLNELENEIKLTKHEEELNNLRKIDVTSFTTTSPVLTSTKVPDRADMKTNHSSRSQCSQYQFECRGSGECIAIYNVCDGISQCSDGSDEVPELDCPTLAGTPRPKPAEQLANSKTSLVGPTLHKSSSHEVLHEAKSEKPNKAPILRHQSSLTGYVAPYEGSQPSEKTQEFPSSQQKGDPHQTIYQGRIYGREGEGLAQQYPLGGMQWQRYQLHHPDESINIFAKKGVGLASDNSDSQNPSPYINDLNHADYFKYSSGTGINVNGYYNGFGPVFYPNNLPVRQQNQQHVNEEIQPRPGMAMYVNGLTAPGPSDYYYEDQQFRGRFPVLQDPRISKNIQNGLTMQNYIPAKDTEKQQVFKASTSQREPEKSTTMASVKKTVDNDVFSTITKNPENKVKHESATAYSKTERPDHGISAELSIAEEDAEYENDRPSGAILSLTLGMCITAIMIALVGCRLRVVRRRMKRNSKSPYAHDADFLVNGMYL